MTANNGTVQKAYADGNVPICARCKLWPGLYGIYGPALASNLPVCAMCLTPGEKLSIETANRQFDPPDRNGGAR